MFQPSISESTNMIILSNLTLDKLKSFPIPAPITLVSAFNSGLERIFGTVHPYTFFGLPLNLNDAWNLVSLKASKPSFAELPSNIQSSLYFELLQGEYIFDITASRLSIGL